MELLNNKFVHTYTFTDSCIYSITEKPEGFICNKIGELRNLD
jgi:hypothetical protein